MTLSPADWIEPEWPAPAGVRALMTTRSGGTSIGAYSSLNLGTAVGDDPSCVERNRAALSAWLPSPPRWLRQVHGTRAVDAATVVSPPEADASFTFEPGVVCVVQVADCLPVLLARRDGTGVAAAHAGWRGLAAGVIEHALEALDCPGDQIVAWLGPAIGPDAFQVGDDVRRAFVEPDPAAAGAFRSDTTPGKWRADLFALARLRLAARGVADVHGGGMCTFANPARFYSFRRDGVTGRMSALVWREP